jgi:cytochrome b561
MQQRYLRAFCCVVFTGQSVENKVLHWSVIVIYIFSFVTKLLRNAPGGGKIPFFLRAGAEN